MQPPPPPRDAAPKAAEDHRYAAPPGRRRVPYKPATVALAIVLGALFLLEVAAAKGQVMSIPAPLLVRLGGNLPTLTREAHEYWRLVTAAFLHGGLIHVGMNVYALLIIGSAIELTLGAGWMMTCFVASGITGSIVSAVGNKPNVVAIGASGGIFGLIAMAAALTWLAPKETGFNRAVLVQWIVFGLVIGVAGGFDNWGHAGGIIGGGLTAFVAAAMRKNPRLLLRVGRVLGVVASLVSVAAIGRAAQSYFTTATAVEYGEGYNTDLKRLVDALNAQDKDKAGPLGDEVAKRYPDDPQAQYFAGSAAALTGRCEEALPRLRFALEPPGPKASDASHRFADSHRLLVEWRILACLYELKRSDEAESARAAFCEDLAKAPADKLAELPEAQKAFCGER